MNTRSRTRLQRSTVGLTAVTALVLAVLPAAAQSNNREVPMPIRLRVADDVRVGQAAPQVVLPYATRDGIGPAAQPFDLRKELGLVVVLAFYPGDFTPGCAAEWRTLRDRAETLFGPDVVVAGISADSLDSHIRFARELDLPFKLLSIAGQEVLDAAQLGILVGRHLAGDTIEVAALRGEERKTFSVVLAAPPAMEKPAKEKPAEIAEPKPED